MYLLIGVKLNISEHDNSQSLENALSVINYFALDYDRANEIIEEVIGAVSKWRDHANALGISKSKQDQMQRAFRAYVPS